MPLLNRTECHDFQAELKRTDEQAAHCRETFKSESPRRTGTQTHQQRSSSLSCSEKSRNTIKYEPVKHDKYTPVSSRYSKKPYAPIAPPQQQVRTGGGSEKCFVSLNDIITDQIGSNFFHNVLGKSDSIQSMSTILQKPPHHASPMRSDIQSKLTPIKPKLNSRGTTPVRPSKEQAPVVFEKDGRIYRLNASQINVSNHADWSSKAGNCVSPTSTFTSVTLTPSSSHFNMDGDLERTFADLEENVAFKETTLVTSDYSMANVNSSCLTDDLNYSENASHLNLNDFDQLIEDLNKFTIKQQSPKKPREALKNVDKIQAKPKSKSKNKIQDLNDTLSYSSELKDRLENQLNSTTSSDVIMANMFECFDIKSPQNVNKPNEWREGHVKSAFNYLLIDPRISQNLPLRAKQGLSELQVFRIFIDSIFYIGKGSRARPYAHLYDTIKIWKNNQQIVTSPFQKPPTKVSD